MRRLFSQQKYNTGGIAWFDSPVRKHIILLPFTHFEPPLSLPVHTELVIFAPQSCFHFGPLLSGAQQGAASMGRCRDTGGFYVLYDEEAVNIAERERSKPENGASYSSSGIGGSGGGGSGGTRGAGGRRPSSSNARQGAGRSWR